MKYRLLHNTAERETFLFDREPFRGMILFVKSRLPERDPRDFVQSAYVRSFAALGREPNPTYLWKALRSEIVDVIRKEAKQRPLSLKTIRDPDISKHPEFLECLISSTDLRAEDRKIMETRLLDRDEDGQVWDAISRKRFSRAKMRVSANLFLKWYEERLYQEVNKHRFPISLMKEVANLALRRGVDLSCFKEAFDYPQWSPSIQNATWALMAVATRVPSVTGFFEQQIHKEHLFRGNVSYIFEALTALDSNNFMELYRKKFLPSLWDLPSRATQDSRPFREQEPFQQRCIVDVIPFVPILTGISLDETELVRKKFLSRADDVDFRRSITWQMLRLRPEDGRTMETAINALADEDDQINAYYIVKFIMGPGLKLFPNKLLTRNTIQSIRSAARRWPQNAYFAESAARVSIKLRQNQGKKNIS